MRPDNIVAAHRSRRVRVERLRKRGGCRQKQKRKRSKRGAVGAAARKKQRHSVRQSISDLGYPSRMKLSCTRVASAVLLPFPLSPNRGRQNSIKTSASIRPTDMGVVVAGTEKSLYAIDSATGETSGAAKTLRSTKPTSRLFPAPICCC